MIMVFRKILEIIYDILLIIGMTIIYISETFIMTLIPRHLRGKSIKGEIALVTGGASGVGKLIAMKLSERGAHVIIWDIHKANLEKTVNEIKRTGGTCWGYYCDISNKEEVYKIAEAIKSEIGNVTLLVNNAGYVYGDTLLNIPDCEIEYTYKVNILSHYWITKAFLKEMMANNHGHIVTIASLAGLLGTYNCTDYSGTKFAAVGFHESLFLELKAHGYDGIYVTSVCPYLIDTGMFNGVKPRLLEMLDPKYVAEEVISGILLNEVKVILPRFIKFLLPFKDILPAKLGWGLMYHIIRGPQAMMMLNTSKKRELLQKNNNIALVN